MNTETAIDEAEIATLNRVREAMQTPSQKAVTEMQKQLSAAPQVCCPLDHEFTNQFYVRTVHVPAGTLVISKIFKADFPFFISKGKVSVWVEGQGVVHRQAPFWGFTKAGTRRIIMHHTDVDWTTIHFTAAKTPEDAEAEIIYKPTLDHPEIYDEVITELQKGAL